MSVLKHSLISAALLAGLASAQWVPGNSANIEVGSWSAGLTHTYTGYNPSYSQNSVLGSSIVNGSADLLLVSDNVTPGTIKVVNANSLDITFLKSQPIATQGSSYIPVAGETAITYEHLGAMVVLRPLNGDAQSAIVVLASTSNLYVCEIKQANAVFTITKLKTIDLPDNSTQATGRYTSAGYSKRLALLSTSGVGTNTQYYLALSNPYYQNGSNAATGRVDFLTLDGAWNMFQTNKVGITGGIPNTMNTLGASALFGIDVASAGDVDGDGVNDLAVLAPASTDYPNSALFIFLMQDASTPKPVSPKILTGYAFPWKQQTLANTPSLTEEQDCKGLSSYDLDGDNVNEFVVNCSHSTNYGRVRLDFLLKLNNLGNIAHSTLLFKDSPIYYGSGFSSPSLLLWENDLQAPRLLTPFRSGPEDGSYYFQSTPLYNVNASKNYAVVAGASPDSVVNIDSLFYKSGQSDYTFKTLSGPASCVLSTGGKGMLCSAVQESAGSWSAIEVTAGGTCAPYQPCKLKDTLHVAATIKKTDFALRMPNQVLPVNHEKVNIGSLRSLAFIRNYSQKSTSAVIFKGYDDKSPLATTASVGAMNTFSFSALATQKNIDTLRIRLQGEALLLDTYPQIHVVSPESLVTTPFAATPGLDTLYAAANGMYYALPLTNTQGAALTYDVQQTLPDNAEVVGNYLRIKNLSNLTLKLNYVENMAIKTRTLILSTEPKSGSNIVTIPFAATSGSDTLYEAASGMYYALPLTNSGAALTYDVPQTFAGSAEIVGGYLHIINLRYLTLQLNYVENMAIKTRTLVLSPDPKPSSTLVTAQHQFSMQAVSAGVQINGLAGDYQVRVFSLNGQLLQQHQSTAYGSTLLPLSHSGVQIVRVQSANQVQVLKVMR